MSTTVAATIIDKKPTRAIDIDTVNPGKPIWQNIVTEKYLQLKYKPHAGRYALAQRASKLVQLQKIIYTIHSLN